MEEATKKILENIRRKRRENSITLLDLALDTGISHSHLYYIESQRVVPSIDVVVKIARALNLSLKDLLA
ncbi:MAG: helix-turn-helix domain-containing protein [Candidatus Margulisbacteria bacterium]|jgi:transcriptional regulator with XRE-family HTH domain|nr:helix-turn-helix domain-containing protein [Candidatus Margulisiibacteriota bacterium]